jgi:hypothetical protein
MVPLLYQYYVLHPLLLEMYIQVYGQSPICECKPFHEDHICCLVVRVPAYKSRGLDSRHYQISWEVVGLEQGPLGLVSTIEKLLERKSSGSSLENREYGRRDPSCWPHGTLYPQKLALASPTSGGRSVSIVRSRIQTTEITLVYSSLYREWCENTYLMINICCYVDTWHTITR